MPKKKTATQKRIAPVGKVRTATKKRLKEDEAFNVRHEQAKLANKFAMKHGHRSKKAEQARKSVGFSKPILGPVPRKIKKKK